MRSILTMFNKYSHDGAVCDYDKFVEKGYSINRLKDLRISTKSTSRQGKEELEIILKFDFVGFIVDKENTMFTVFPKNFNVKNQDDDSYDILSLFKEYYQRNPDKYLGDLKGEEFSTNFPFAAFYNILKFYNTFGLSFDKKSVTKINHGGKVDWKQTIKRLEPIISENRLVVYPLHYKRNNIHINYVTICMLNAINYTVSKFGTLIKEQRVNIDALDSYHLEDHEQIVANLINIKQYEFVDVKRKLVDDLIDFYSNLLEGGNYYFKHYNFESIWETIVLEFLNNYFDKMTDNGIILDPDKKTRANFSKRSFSPNSENKNQTISPDFYYTKDNFQYIFDAKYKYKMDGIDYKQVAYFMFLKDYREREMPKYIKTYSALFLPSNERRSRVHFQMDPSFSNYNSDIRIIEEYLDIRSVIRSFLKRD